MHGLVELKTFIPGIVLDIRYATENNFTGRVVYPSARCFLRRETAEKLRRVQAGLERGGLGLKVFDGYRPCHVQKIFWEILPDPRFVADPKKGSKHSRGASVDVGLVRDGAELFMGTAFDDFSEESSWRYEGAGSSNRDILKEAMEAGGFVAYENEWWHFDDEDWENYPLLDVPIPP